MKPKLESGTRGTARLFDAIKASGYNREMFIELGVVVSENPELQIEVDDNVVLDADDLVIAEHLTNHTRTVKIGNSSSETTIEFTDELSLGDRVMVISDDDTDEYFVIDRVVEYDVSE